MILEAFHIYETFLQQQQNAEHNSIKIFYFLSKLGLKIRWNHFIKIFFKIDPLRFLFLENFNHTDFRRLFSLNFV